MLNKALKAGFMKDYLNSPLIIRLMVKNDLPLVLKIIDETMLPEDVDSAKHTFTLYFLEKEGKISSSIYLSKFSLGEFYVAELNGMVVGVSGFYKYNHSYWLGWFAVSPKYQGNGVGTMLLKKVEENVRKSGAKKLFVYTSMHQKFEKARRFYMKKGFRKVENVTYPRIEEDMVFFCKKL